MNVRFLLLPILLAAAGCAGPSRPQATQACPNGNSDLPSAWAGWNTARLLTAARSAAEADDARFVPDQAIDLRLHPDPEVAYVSLPQGEGEAASFGGLAAFRVERAERYGVGAGASAWIDVSRDGKPTATASFGPGPACSPVRKVVAFDLVPGDYILEISGNETPDLRVMVVAGGLPYPRR